MKRRFSTGVEKDGVCLRIPDRGDLVEIFAACGRDAPILAMYGISVVRETMARLRVSLREWSQSERRLGGRSEFVKG
jgi:hypothetical protein